MQEDDHLAEFKLEKSVRHPKEFPALEETTYKVLSNRPDHKKFPYITFVNHNQKIQVCDMERYFYIIPTNSTSTLQVKENKKKDSKGNKHGGAKDTVIKFSEGIYPCQLFPKQLISNVQPKNSKKGHKVYLMICVDSPLFIHRKNDVIKMSIDFKDSPIINVFYDLFVDRDILSILILTQKNSQNCLIDLKNLKILKRVIKKGPRMPMISSFIAKSIGTNLFAIDRDGKLYQDGCLVHNPQTRKFTPKNLYLTFLAEDTVISKVVKDTNSNMVVIIGYTKSEHYDPNKRKGKKGYRDALTLSLLNIHTDKKGKVKYQYPDTFTIDHPKFCKFRHRLQSLT